MPWGGSTDAGPSREGRVPGSGGLHPGRGRWQPPRRDRSLTGAGGSLAGDGGANRILGDRLPGADGSAHRPHLHPRATASVRRPPAGGRCLPRPRRRVDPLRRRLGRHSPGGRGVGGDGDQRRGRARHRPPLLRDLGPHGGDAARVRGGGSCLSGHGGAAGSGRRGGVRGDLRLGLGGAGGLGPGPVLRPRSRSE